MTAPLRCIVADDEEAPRQQLITALRQAWPDLTVVAEVANGIDAWDAFLEHEPELCFLDVRMPGLSGIDVARRIGTKAQVVFATAHGEHAVAAFDAGAVDYLMKPIEPARLARTVERLRSRLTAATPTPDLHELLATLNAGVRKPAPLSVLQASSGREVKLIRCDEVIYFESDTRYTRVVHEGGEALIRTALKELLARLDEQLFWQIHRSVIVNHRWIASAVRVDEGVMHVTLRGRTEKLPVSRHFQGLFKGQ